MSYSYLPLCFSPFSRDFVCSCMCIVCCVNLSTEHASFRGNVSLGNWFVMALFEDKRSEIRLAKLQYDLGVTPFPLSLCPLSVDVTLSK